MRRPEDPSFPLGPPAPGAPWFVYLQSPKDAASVVAQIQKELPRPIRVRKLTLFDHYAKVEVQDPNDPGRVVFYLLSEGEFGEPTLHSEEPGRRALEEALFDVTEADFERVPLMADDAVEYLKVCGGVVSHMVLERGKPYHKDNELRWYVYVNACNDRHGLVEYDARGRLRKVWP